MKGGKGGKGGGIVDGLINGLRKRAVANTIDWTKFIPSPPTTPMNYHYSLVTYMLEPSLPISRLSVAVYFQPRAIINAVAPNVRKTRRRNALLAPVK